MGRKDIDLMQGNKISISEIREIQLRMMDYIHHYCKEHNIRYFLDYGTLLGCIRHSGYIPWDDDIDISMPRYDYERFIADFNDDCKNSYKVITVDNNKQYYVPFAKIVDTTTSLKEKNDYKLELGVYIDVFPIDNLGDKKYKAIIMFNMQRVNRLLLDIKAVSVRPDRVWYKNIILYIGKKILKRKTSNEIAEKINSFGKRKMSDSLDRYVGNIVYCPYGMKQIMNGSWYDISVAKCFEERELIVPKYYNCILSRLYGNYMKLPPYEKRISHHKYDAYTKK